MADQKFHIGGIHSNYKFGKPTPRTFRQAFGEEFDGEFDETKRSMDGLVLAFTLACFVIGLVVGLWPW